MFFVSHTHFCNSTLVCARSWKPHPFLYVHVCTKSDHLQACIMPCLSINCCCRHRECYPCSMSASHGITALQSTCISLCKATPTFSKHIMVPVILLEPHTALCNTPTVLVFADICVAIRTHNLLIAQILTHTLVLAIWVKSRSSGSAVVTRFQRCHVLNGFSWMDFPTTWYTKRANTTLLIRANRK